MTATFAEAIAHDEAGRIVEAVAAYEELIAEGGAPEEAFVNLAYLYGLTGDFGFLVHHDLSSAYARSCSAKFDAMIADGLATHPESADIWLASHYAPDLFWGDRRARVTPEEMAARPVQPRFAALYRSRSPQEESNAAARKLLEELEGDETQAAHYVRSVLRSGLGLGPRTSPDLLRQVWLEIMGEPYDGPPLGV